MHIAVLVGTVVVCNLLVLPTLPGVESVNHVEPSEVLESKFRHDSEGAKEGVHKGEDNVGSAQAKDEGDCSSE